MDLRQRLAQFCEMFYWANSLMFIAFVYIAILVATTYYVYGLLDATRSTSAAASTSSSYPSTP